MLNILKPHENQHSLTYGFSEFDLPENNKGIIR